MYIKIYKLRKFLGLMTTLLCINLPLFAQAKDDKIVSIDQMDRSWFTVLSGSPSSSPLQTAYGFVLIEDNKFLANYSRNGQRLWQTNTGARITNVSVSDTEFIAVTNQKNQIQLLNPSGLLLWKKNLDFAPYSSPLFGYDGRIFIRGKNQINCYGINGLLKWTIQTDAQNSLHPQQLNDGSFIIFLEKTHDGKTCALRISPFGGILEEIVFQGKVVNSFYSENGIILVFSGGETGMCSIKTDGGKESGLIYSKWINKNLACNEYSQCKKISSKKYAIFTPGKNLSIIYSENGQIEKSFSIPEISNSQYLFFEQVDDKLIIAQNDICVIYNTSGKIVKVFRMPSKSGKYNWEYSCFINSGYLTFLSRDWTVNSFKLISTSKEKESPTFAYYQSRNLKSGYNTFLSSLSYKPEKNKFNSEVLNSAMKGNYGQSEIQLSDTINAVINSYYETKTTQGQNHQIIEPVIPDYNFSDMESALSFIPVFQSHYFQQKLALLLSIENDKTMIIKILKTIQQCGYDPGGELLTQIEILVKRTNPRDQAVLQEASKAVYEICRFMGRPALLSKGKEILMGMFYPQYDEATKKAARQAMQKLAELNM